jgi:hypothetical protein
MAGWTARASIFLFEIWAGAEWSHFGSFSSERYSIVELEHQHINSTVLLYVYSDDAMVRHPYRHMAAPGSRQALLSSLIASVLGAAGSRSIMKN